MKIISGKYRNFLIQHDLKSRIRPTQSRVKESIFNIIGDISNSHVLDLCCGSGQIGLEAISRGAQSCIFVDIDLRCLFHNLNRLSEFDSAIFNVIELKKRDCLNYVRSKTDSDYCLDFIFFDPPWTMSERIILTLNHIMSFDILSASGILVFEHPKSFVFAKDLSPLKTYSYGNTSVSLFQRTNE